MTKITNKQDNLLAFKLLFSENKFSTMFQLSPVGMAIVDSETGSFLEVNDAVLNSAGYTKEEFINLSYWDITPKEYEEQERQQIKDLKATGRFGPNEKEYIRKDGTKYPINISGVALTDVNGREVVLGIIEDISERKAYEQTLKQYALHDPLTGLPNRRLLSEKLQLCLAQCQRNKQPLALFLLDLDHFKPVNDSFGHEVGDKLLQAITQRIISVTHRKTDTVSRMGGDEFVVVLPLINAQDAHTFAKQLCDELANPFIIENKSITVSASVGIAIFPEHGDNEKTLRTKADIAMYQVKESGGNNFTFFEPK